MHAMGSSHHYYLMFSAVLVVAAASLCLADDPFICTRATYYGSPECYGNPSIYLSIYLSTLRQLLLNKFKLYAEMIKN